ncbi:LysR substrate-binding domain-containing protein [Breoghania sp.]|uniref:LysR substrate-binding domain-containing protein n=1 Tax=Breoghania sp. TaxID=2065378 RepID=UPI0029CA0683|nr:LysR substrate-binding domain-containing protein [Breoghania sp.]
MSYGLDIDQLRTFIAIAELGSFTRAADAVNRTQSAVSMQMRRLEERVGQALFTRDGRQSRLTDSGYRLQDYARRMIRLNDETLTAFAEPELLGRVRLGLPDDYAERLLPQVLAGFACINPTVEVVVECTGSIGVSEKVRRDELDLGIVTSCGDLNGFGDIVRRERLYWVGPESRRIHDEETVRLALGHETCAWRSLAINTLSRVGRSCRVAYTSGSAAAITSAVAAGLAIAVVPESALRPGLRILDARDGFPDLPPANIALIRAPNAVDATHDALYDHIAAAIGNLPMRAAAE